MGFIMKKKIRAVLAAVVAGGLLGACVPTASAGELRLWEHEQFKGHTISFSYCDADFADNIYDSGQQDLKEWVSIWNNSVIAGDKRIAKIYRNQRNPSFGALNQADHATCLG